MDQTNENAPLVSVITPVYNSPDLQTAIDSVLAQTYSAIEYIIVDDHSEQFSTSEVHQYIQTRCGQNIKRFLIVRNDVNQGTVQTLNRGLQLANGKYFFQLAGDDAFSDPTVIEDWVAAFQKRHSLVMTAKRANYDERMEEYFGTSPSKKQMQMIRRLSPEKLFEKLSAVNFIFGCCTAYDADFMRRIGFYDTRYRLIEDHPMNLRLLRSGIQINFFDRVVIKYRGGGKSSHKMYDSTYEQDSDMVFRNEVMPYTRKPRNAIFHYQRWKKQQRQMKKYQKRQLEVQGRPLQKALLKTQFYFSHPVKTIKIIFNNPRTLKKVLGWLHREDL